MRRVPLAGMRAALDAAAAAGGPAAMPIEGLYLLALGLELGAKGAGKG